MLGNNLNSADILKYFSYFPQKIGFGISCKLSPRETICLKCQNLFSGKSKKNIILCVCRIAHRMVTVNVLFKCSIKDKIFSLLTVLHYKGFCGLN